MTRGILFYCDRDGPIAALIVALWTLRRTYSEPIHIVLGPQSPFWFIVELQQSLPSLALTYELLAEYDFPEWTRGKRGSWCQKPFAIRRSPFDVTIYLDCDHLFTGKPWPEAIWQDVGEAGLGSAHDRRAANRGPMIVRDLRAVTGIELQNYRPVNGGCIGWKRGCSDIERWIDFMILFARQQKSRLLRSLAEEYALGMVVNTGRGGWFNASVSRVDYPHHDACGYHLSDRRYSRNPVWKHELRQCMKVNFLGVRRNAARLEL